MSITVAELQPVLHNLFTTTADDLARETGFCQRRRKLDGPAFAQILTFTWLEKPSGTLDDLADTAEDLGIDVSPQAIDQRFTQAAAAFLQELLGDALQHVFDSALPSVLPMLHRFPGGVHIRDGSVISLPPCLAPLLPGCGGSAPEHGAAALKFVLGLELTRGVLEGVNVLTGRDNEQTCALAHAPLPEETLLLEDMGFFSLERMESYDQQKVYILSRLPVRTAVFTPDKRRLDLVKWLGKQSAWQVSQRVLLGAKKWLPCRLLAVRVPEQEAEQRRQRVRREARDKGRSVSQAKLALCEWNILITNAPEDRLRVSEAVDLRRVRWQIELLFKTWKSEGRIDESQGNRPWRVLCEVYAKLLAMIVQHWSLVAAGWVALRYSGIKAARRVRDLAKELLASLRKGEDLERVVRKLARRLQRRCRIKSRHATPTTYDRLLALDPDFEQLCQAA